MHQEKNAQMLMIKGARYMRFGRSPTSNLRCLIKPMWSFDFHRLILNKTLFLPRVKRAVSNTYQTLIYNSSF